MQSKAFLKALRRKYRLGEFKRKRRSKSSAKATTTRRTTKDLLGECRARVKAAKAGLRLSTAVTVNPFMIK